MLTAFLRRQGRTGMVPVQRRACALRSGVVASNGQGAYTGETLDWSLLSRDDNVESAEGGRSYKYGFARLPTVDHVGDGLGPADFKICGWRVNDAKHDLDMPAFLSVCRTVLEQYGFVVTAPPAQQAHFAILGRINSPVSIKEGSNGI